MFLRAALLAIALPSIALATDPLTAVVNQAPPVSPVAPTPPTGLMPTVSQPVIVESSPAASGEWILSDQNRQPVFGMDLMLGQQSGIRPTITLFSTEKSSLVAEAFYGALLTKFGTSEGAGAGVRWLMCRGGCDSVTFGPGVDVMFNFADGQATFLAPTIDLAWQHRFGERACLVLGLNAGIGIGLSNIDEHHDYYGDRDDNISGKITPLISLFGGLRF